MILISHRGNINGPNKKEENKIDYILNAINQGYDVEIDIWYIKNIDKYYLGHDNPEYEVDIDFLMDNENKLWIHCKNHDAFINLLPHDNLNIFWHTTEDVILTSKKYMWVYPGKDIENSIAVMPEIHNDNTENRIGICSDYINNYK